MKSDGEEDDNLTLIVFILLVTLIPLIIIIVIIICICKRKKKNVRIKYLDKNMEVAKGKQVGLSGALNFEKKNSQTGREKMSIIELGNDKK